jgi:hypothetical protein
MGIGDRAMMFWGGSVQWRSLGPLGSRLLGAVRFDDWTIGVLLIKQHPNASLIITYMGGDALAKGDSASYAII